MDELKGKSLLYGWLVFSLNRSENRLKLRDTAARLMEENRLQSLIDLTRKYARSPLRFWLLIMFAFNPANLKRRSPWVMVMLALEVLIAPIVIVGGAIFLGNFTVALASIIFILFIPSFLGMAMEASIQSEDEPDVAMLRCWLLLHARRTGEILATGKEISSNLVSLLRPYSEEQYMAKHRLLNKLGKGGLYAMFFLSAVMIWAVTFEARFMKNPWVTGALLVLTFSMIGPGVVDQWFESTRKPLLYDDHSLVIPDDYGLTQEPRIDDVVNGYESSRVWRGMKFRAWLIYYFGSLFAWDTDRFPEVGIGIFLLIFFILVRSFASPTTNIALLNVVTVLIPVLIVYSIASSWRSSGGVSKAKARKQAYREVLIASSLELLIPKEKLLEIYQVGAYLTSSDKASRDQLVTSLYVRSIPIRRVRNLSFSQPYG